MPAAVRWGPTASLPVYSLQNRSSHVLRFAQARRLAARRRTRRCPGHRDGWCGIRPQAAYAKAPAANVAIPYEEFTLPNGLRVIVHTDRKAPIVAVNIWYHVGSKDEPLGRSGFAHLFEHLMFNGSENHPGEYFVPFKQVGVTDQNGTTNTDRTNYFENVPTTALDMALWMESTAWATCSARSTRRRSTSSVAWSRTRSARARTSPTARPSTCSPRSCIRRAIRITTR
jgi:hypothetical protein